jgi:hypothetical protein
MSEELVDLGHNGDSTLRADGLVNALTGMGTRRDKSQYTNSTPIVFLSQEELENLYSEWIPKRIVDIVAEQSTRKGFKVLFGGEGAAAEEVSGVEQVIEDLYILENLGLASKNARLLVEPSFCFTSTMVVPLSSQLTIKTFVLLKEWKC